MAFDKAKLETIANLFASRLDFPAKCYVVMPWDRDEVDVCMTAAVKLKTDTGDRPIIFQYRTTGQRKEWENERFAEAKLINLEYTMRDAIEKAKKNKTLTTAPWRTDDGVELGNEKIDFETMEMLEV